MQPLVITPATIILLAIIAVCAFLAIRRLVRRGMCDCHESKKGSSAGCAGCSHCSMAVNANPKRSSATSGVPGMGNGSGDAQPPCCHGVDHMVANLNHALK